MIHLMIRCTQVQFAGPQLEFQEILVFADFDLVFVDFDLVFVDFDPASFDRTLPWFLQVGISWLELEPA
jgi:hypothetical protein